MLANLISGIKIASEIKVELVEKIFQLKNDGIVPGLVVVLVGEDPASISYVTAKSKACQEIGIVEETLRIPVGVTEDDFLKIIDQLNRNLDFHGILVQLPLPKYIDELNVINAILPEKDVDGFHPINVGKLLIGNPVFIPCTPFGIYQLLLRSGIDISGKHIVICGRSNIVGKPLAALFLQKKAELNGTVTVCHSGTKDLSFFTKQADILVVAMGIPRFITADMIKEGAVVVDVGVNRIEDRTKKSGFRLVGDVDFEMAKEKVFAITPVPGGVGPMTIAMLLSNVVHAAEMRYAV